MTRTQIQLPDDVYQDLKALAEAKEWSLAEAVRRGVELLLRSYPRPQEQKATWQLPEARSMGAFRIPPEQWRDVANTKE
jgi:hypothetical protein